MASKPWLADLAEDVAEDRAEGLLATLRDRAFFAAAFFAFLAMIAIPSGDITGMLGQPSRIANRNAWLTEKCRWLASISRTTPDNNGGCA
jgi:hypothetical protein